MADLKALADAVIKGDQSAAVEITKAALEEGTAAKSVLDDGLIAGMDIVGARFKKNEIYIPEVLIAARAMNMAMEVLEPELVKAGVEPVGKFLIGTVQGDLHDIGKNLVAMSVEGAGWEVVDLGVDVSADKFLSAITRDPNAAVGLSALLTTTMESMAVIVEKIRAQAPEIKILVGGAPLTQAFCNRIGADFYSPNPQGAVQYLDSLVAS